MTLAATFDLLRSKTFHSIFTPNLNPGKFFHFFFVSIMTLTVVGYAFFATQSPAVIPKHTLNSINFRILDSNWNRNIFSNEYIIQWQGNKWLLISSERYRNGLLMQLVGEFVISHFDSNQSTFDKYRISQGFLGEIKAKNVISQGGRCDSFCSLIQLRTNLTTTFKKNISTKSCYYWKKPIEYLYKVGPCEDISIFLVGLIIKDSTPISPDLSLLMKSSGLTHIISVSGFQITTFGLMLELALQKLYIGRKKEILIIIPILLGYTLIAGFQPPVIRALLSTSISLLVLTSLGRRVRPFLALLYSSLVMLVIFPHFITSYSFLLSFVSTLSLIATPDIKITNKYIEVFLVSIYSTIFAFLFTFPIISQFGNAVNPLLVIIGSILLPFIPFISIGVLLGTIPWIGELFILVSGSLLGVFLTLMGEINTYTSKIIFQPNSLTDTLFYYFLLLLCMVFLRALVMGRFRLKFFPASWKKPQN